MCVKWSYHDTFYTCFFLSFSLRFKEQKERFGQHILDKIFKDKSDKTQPYSRTIQLYSVSSAKFVQVMGRNVNASGKLGSDTGE